MGITTDCMKYTLFLFNLVFFVAGGVVLGAGVWILVDDSFFTELVQVGAQFSGAAFDPSEVLTMAPYVLVTVGGAIAGLAFLGCCGAIKELRPLLIIYGILLFIILVFIIGIAVTSKLEEDRAQEYLGLLLRDTLKQYDNVTDVAAMWDVLQAELNCCGVMNGSDYADVNLPAKGQKVPVSCCELTNGTDFLRQGGQLGPEALVDQECPSSWAAATKHGYADTGCKEQLIVFLKEYTFIVSSIGLGISAVLVLGIVFACCLTSVIGKGKDLG